MSNILVLQSGLPFSVFTTAPFNPILDRNGNVIGLQAGSGDFNADGYAYDLPNAPAAGVVHTGSRSNFLRICSRIRFPRPYTRTTGQSGPEHLHWSRLANINTEFAKVVKWERFSVEFRADVFNLFNRVNLTQPDGDLSSSLFGQSTSQNLPRSCSLASPRVLTTGERLDSQPLGPQFALRLPHAGGDGRVRRGFALLWKAVVRTEHPLSI